MLSQINTVFSVFESAVAGQPSYIYGKKSFLGNTMGVNTLVKKQEVGREMEEEEGRRTRGRGERKKKKEGGEGRDVREGLEERISKRNISKVLAYISNHVQCIVYMQLCYQCNAKF